jgi:hypothetical protein
VIENQTSQEEKLYSVEIPSPQILQSFVTEPVKKRKLLKSQSTSVIKPTGNLCCQCQKPKKKKPKKKLVPKTHSKSRTPSRTPRLRREVTITLDSSRPPLTDKTQSTNVEAKRDQEDEKKRKKLLTGFREFQKSLC